MVSAYEHNEMLALYCVVFSLQSLSCDALLSSIARCAADHPVAIILSGLQLTMLDEQGWQPPKNLPENLHLVMLTSDNSLLDTWSNGVSS